MKKLLGFLASVLVSCGLAFGAGSTPIQNLRLVGPADGAGNSFTNLNNISLTGNVTFVSGTNVAVLTEIMVATLAGTAPTGSLITTYSKTPTNDVPPNQVATVEYVLNHSGYATNALYASTAGVASNSYKLGGVDASAYVTQYQDNVTFGTNTVLNGDAIIHGDVYVDRTIFVSNMWVTNIYTTYTQMMVNGSAWVDKNLYNSNSLIASNGVLYSGGNEVLTNGQSNVGFGTNVTVTGNATSGTQVVNYQTATNLIKTLAPVSTPTNWASYPALVSPDFGARYVTNVTGIYLGDGNPLDGLAGISLSSSRMYGPRWTIDGGFKVGSNADFGGFSATNISDLKAQNLYLPTGAVVGRFLKCGGVDGFATWDDFPSYYLTNGQAGAVTFNGDMTFNGTNYFNQDMYTGTNYAFSVYMADGTVAENATSGVQLVNYRTMTNYLGREKLLFVNPTYGSDVSGTGSRYAPFQTINAAMLSVPVSASSDAGITEWGSEKLIFELAPGVYNGDVQLYLARARIGLRGDGVQINGSLTLSVRTNELPYGAGFLQATYQSKYPYPWTGAAIAPTLDINGQDAGGAEAGYTAMNFQVRRPVILDFVGGSGSTYWQDRVSSSFVTMSHVQLLEGCYVKGLAPNVTFEVNDFSIQGGVIASYRTSAFPTYLKAHSGQLKSIIGPITVNKVDGCRIQGGFDATYGEVYGTHKGTNNSPWLVDTTQVWTANAYTGRVVYNDSDNSYGTVLSNTVDTIYAALTNGTQNDWDTGEAYHLSPTSGVTQAIVFDSSTTYSGLSGCAIPSGTTKFNFGASGAVVIYGDDATIAQLAAKTTLTNGAGTVKLVSRGVTQGATSARPTTYMSTATKGFSFFDTTVGAPYWWDGASWITALTNVPSTYVSNYQSGVSFGSLTTTVALVSQSQPDVYSWSTKAGLPTARTMASAASFGGNLYALGSVSDTTNVSSFNGTNWIAAPGLPAARRSMAVATFGGMLYSLGGITNGTAQTNVFAFNGTNWAQVAGMPEVKGNFGAAVLGSKLYAIGGATGFGDTSPTNSVLAFDGTNWTVSTPLPYNLKGFGTATLGGYLYVVGGWSSSYTNSVLRFDGTNWVSVANLPAPRHLNTVVVIGNYLYSVGGSTGVANNNVYRFDGSSWTEVAPLTVANSGMGSGVLGGTGYVVGGSANSGTGTYAFAFSSQAPIQTWKDVSGSNVAVMYSGGLMTGGSNSFNIGSSNAPMGNGYFTNLMMNGVQVLTNAPAQVPPTNWSSYPALTGIDIGNQTISNYFRICAGMQPSIFIDSPGQLHSFANGYTLDWSMSQLQKNGTPVLDWGLTLADSMQAFKPLILRNDGANVSTLSVMADGQYLCIGTNALLYSRGNLVLTNIPSYYLTNGQASVNFGDISQSGWHYFHGDAATDDSWRQGYDSVSSNVVVQVRVGGTWTNSVMFMRP